MSVDICTTISTPSSYEGNSSVQTPSPRTVTSSASLSNTPQCSRLITPAPPSITTRTTVVTASPRSLDNARASPVGGPTSTSYVVPPRPKPGRKPATDEPASKRKAQNRESQRAFRARKAAKLNELAAQAESSEQRHQREMGEKMTEINELQIERTRLAALLAQEVQAKKRTVETNKRLEQERDYWKDRFDHQEQAYNLLSQQVNAPITRQIGRTQNSATAAAAAAATIGIPQLYSKVDIGCGRCKVNGECACVEEMAKLPSPGDYVPLQNSTTREASSPARGLMTPNASSSDAGSYFDREIDFTAQFSSKRSRVDHRASINFMTQSTEVEVDSNCGFCTDDSNCMCKQDLRAAEEAKPVDDMPPPPREINGVASRDRKPSLDDCRSTGPGSCADCMSNPRQRAWCQRVAELRNEPNPPASDFMTSRNSSFSSALDPIESKNVNTPIPDMNMSNRYSIGCADAFKLFEGRVSMDAESMDWIDNLKAVPARRDTLQPQRKYSALELDTAGVIATLQQSMAPLAPRASDGAHADVIELASRKQRESPSPLTPRGNESYSTPKSRTNSKSPCLPISTLINSTNR